jgi:hypothetical protein
LKIVIFIAHDSLILVISPWYWIAPIIAVACIVLVLAIIFLVRRVLLSRAWRLPDINHDSRKMEQKVIFFYIEYNIKQHRRKVTQRIKV